VPMTAEPSIWKNHKRFQLCMSSQFCSEWRATSRQSSAPRRLQLFAAVTPAGRQ
jgi:hypothetical protein